MWWKKSDKFWKAGLAGISKPLQLLRLTAAGLAVAFIMGCGEERQITSNIMRKESDSETLEQSAVPFDDAAKDSVMDNSAASSDAKLDEVAEIYGAIYKHAVETNTAGSLEMARRMVDALGRHGYTAVDSENQVDMVHAEKAVEFCEAAEAEEKRLSIVVAAYAGGLSKYDFQKEDGEVTVTKDFYQYENGHMRHRSTVSFLADIWKYTEEGYLLFEGSYFSESYYLYALSDVPEQAALRVQPLDETCRELNRKYILPVGYRNNNLFLTDWSEDDFEDLDFYDLFDRFYPMVYQQPIPYVADENLSVRAVYQIPAEEFEHVIQTYIAIDSEELRQRTVYFPENRTYEYSPRGFEESEYPDIPYPEVVSYTKNQDGTITLLINAVYPDGNTSRSYTHQTVIRPEHDGTFRYVSNQFLGEDIPWWHMKRLTGEKISKSFLSEGCVSRFMRRAFAVLFPSLEKSSLQTVRQHIQSIRLE